MKERKADSCPECSVNRRGFLSVLGGGVAVAAVASTVRGEDKPAAKTPKPAEELIKELHAGLSDEQKGKVVLPWDHGSGNPIPTRLGMYNAPINKNNIGTSYTKPQQELCDRIFRAIVSDDEGYHRMSRGGTWDASKSFENIGFTIFGNPATDKRFAALFTGHHLTLRCDSDMQDNIAWGGPMYYGHSPNGYAETNVFNFQTQKVIDLFKALDGKQQEKALVAGSPGEQAESVRFRKPSDARPGISFVDLSGDQKKLIEEVMRACVSPYRKEDAEEVMANVKANGGFEKMNIAFYKDKDAQPNERWSFWRVEGPGFIWNYRVLPHVHCFVNIGKPVA